jgi:hypothetical protein
MTLGPVPSSSPKPIVVPELPPDPVKTVTEAIPSVTVALIGNGTGPGDLPAGTVIVTPDHRPNGVVTYISPFVAILMRAAYMFFKAFSGFIVGSGTGFLPMTLKAMFISAGTVTMAGVITDCTTVFSGLEKKFPLASGSV